MPSAIVVGAGLAGLNCARTLQESGFDVIVLEKSDRVGGRVKTDYVEGFQFDHGFQVINPAYSEIKRLKINAELDLRALPKGFELEIANKNYLVGDPRYSLKFLPGGFSKETGSLSEKLAFLWFLLRKPGDHTLGQAMSRSGNFYTQILKGFLDGVFLTDSNRVSSVMAHELLRWFVRGNPGVPAKGVAELPRLLSRNLDIRLNCEVEEILQGTLQTSQGVFHADTVVVAADPKATVHLLQLPQITMNSSWTWYHCVDSQAVQSKFLKVLHNGALMNSVAISNIAPDYAPHGTTLISSSTLQNLTEKDATHAVSRAWKLNPSDLRFLRRYEIRDSLPFHGPGKPLYSPQRISEHAVVAGDGFAIPAQQGALRSGRVAAEIVIADQ